MLLIVDNHASHISLAAVNLCRENGVVMIGLPPHTTHRLQPLDVSFFGPLKTYYSQACDYYMVNHPGKTITDKEVGRLFGEAYVKAAAVGTAMKGFEKCSIEPFNPAVFSDLDFMPSDVSERRQVNLTNLDNEFSSDDDDPLMNLKLQNKIQDQAIIPETEIMRPSTHQNLPGPSFASDSPRPYSPLQPPGHFTPPHRPSTPVNLLGPSKSDKSAGPSTSRQADMVKEDKGQNTSLWKIRPLPKYDRPVSAHPRKRLKSSVITSTPIKHMLEEKKKEEQQKEERKMKRTEKVTRKVFGEKKCSKGKKKEEKAVCPGCEEPFMDPPTEDWIKCASCSVWWHEMCTAYEQGQFTCDFCT